MCKIEYSLSILIEQIIDKWIFMVGKSFIWNMVAQGRLYQADFTSNILSYSGSFQVISLSSS